MHTVLAANCHSCPFLSHILHVTFPFRPQYIYGPLTNKRDYLDWFFDRVVHGLEFVPLPLHGDQLVALTHAEDVASMLASVVGNENAVNQVGAVAPLARTFVGCQKHCIGRPRSAVFVRVSVEPD